MEKFSPQEVQHRTWHWLIRLPIAIFLLLCVAVCLAGSATLILDPRSKNPLVAQTAGIVMSLVCLWLASVAIRLMLNRPSYGGLLSPLVLRLAGTYAIAFPIFLMITGHSADWPFWRYLQAVSFIVGGAAMWRIAAWRKASHLKA